MITFSILFCSVVALENQQIMRKLEALCLSHFNSECAGGTTVRTDSLSSPSAKPPWPPSPMTEQEQNYEKLPLGKTNKIATND